MDSSQLLIPLYSTLLVAAAFIAAGLLLGFLQSIADGLLSALLGPVVSRGWSTIFLPGILMHELSHAAFLFVTGARVDEIVVREGTRHPWVLYERRGHAASCSYASGTAGHVAYRRRGPYVLRSIQRVTGAMAPTIVGIVCLALLWQVITVRCTLWWHYAIAIYLFICALNGATMSSADVRDMAPGLPVCLAILYVAFLLSGFDAAQLLPADARIRLAAFANRAATALSSLPVR